MKIVMQRVAIASCFALLVGSLFYLPLASWVFALVEWGQHHPVAGPIAYLLFVIVATILFLPGSVALMIGGFVFGFLPALLYAAIAIPLGAQGAFECGRWVARPWVAKKVAHNRQMHAIELALREQAFVIVLLTRLSLVIPFNLLNYAYGASSVKATTHLAATAIGMLPAIALFVYVGTLARDLGQILSGDAAGSELGYWIFAAGTAAIIVLTWVIHRTATRSLEKHLQDKETTQ